MTQSKFSNEQSGFSLPEVIVSVAVSGILSLVMITVSFFYYADIVRRQAGAELAIESQLILRRVTEDIRTASSIRETNLNTDENAPAGGWLTSNPNNVIIISAPALTSDRNIIYNPETGLPYENEFVYFAENSTMTRRTIANLNAPGNSASTTCPAELQITDCSSDSVLSSNLSNLQFLLYDINGDITNITNNARSVSMTLTLERRIFGQDVVIENTVRVTLRNYQ